MALLRNTPRRMNRLADRIERAVDSLVREIFSDIAMIVIVATPVDTGEARGNWQSSAGFPELNTTNRLAPTGGQSVTEALTVARRAPFLTPLYLTNNVGHIGPLNRGSSPQASAGFISDSVSRGVRVAVSRRRTLL